MKQNDCIVVTGAGGLVGSAVVEHLRSLKYTCVVGLTHADCDLMNHDETREVFDRIRPAHVFHAAARVYGIGGNMANQAKSFVENTRINTSVVDAAYRADVKKITVMGTNAVYSSEAPLPHREIDIFFGRPHQSESGYGHAKRGMLAMLEAYEENYGTAWAYLVSGNLYGPRDRFDPVTGHVIPTMMWKFYEASVDRTATVDLWGDGSPRRDFLYVRDLARAAHATMSSDAIGSINVGSGIMHRIAHVADIMCGITGVSRERVRWDRDMPSGRQECCADLKRLRDHLGFIPQYSLEDGLHMTWTWYKASRETKKEEGLSWDTGVR